MKTLPSLLTSFTCATLLATGHAQQPDDAVDIKQFDSKLAKDTTVLPTSGHTPHSPTPVRVLTVPGAAGAKANSLQSGGRGDGGELFVVEPGAKIDRWETGGGGPRLGVGRKIHEGERRWPQEAATGAKENFVRRGPRACPGAVNLASFLP